MSLAVGFHDRDRDVAVELAIGDGERVALLGENGAGKSTVLEVVAGFLTPSGARVVIDGVTVASAGSPPLPAERRRVGLLAQDALLFPHLDVLDNVAFGPSARGASRSDARERARAMLETVDATALARRRPASLSGGQAQRVALARALATEPDVLLLDEPMAALDVSAAALVRDVLATLAPRVTTLLVTHDAVDALALADRAVVLERGRVVADGPPHAVLARPASPFVARLAGVGLIAGTAAPGGLETADGTLVPGVAEGVRDGDAAWAVVPPRAATILVGPLRAIARGAGGGAVLSARVTGLEPVGGRLAVRLELGEGRDPGRDASQAGALVADAALADAPLLRDRPGRVAVRLEASEVAVYPRGGGRPVARPSGPGV